MAKVAVVAVPKVPKVVVAMQMAIVVVLVTEEEAVVRARHLVLTVGGVDGRRYSIFAYRCLPPPPPPSPNSPRFLEMTEIIK